MLQKYLFALVKIRHFSKKLGVKIRKITEIQIVSVYGIFPKNLNGISKKVKDEFAFNLKISI